MNLGRRSALALAVAATVTSVAGASRPGADASSAARSSVLVAFDSSDGFTFANSFLVLRDGRATLRCSAHTGTGMRLVAARASFRLTPEQLRSLRRLLAAARFPTLHRVYRPAAYGTDIPVYWIAYRGKRVYADTSVIAKGKVPTRLTRVIRLLERIVEPEAAKALSRPRA